MIVTGGSSLLPGFGERLHVELRHVCAEQMYKLKPVAAGFAQERRFSSWIGASILASLGTFQQLWYHISLCFNTLSLSLCQLLLPLGFQNKNTKNMVPH
jgi:hypothetical protein